MSKDCSICVYYGPCADRKEDNTINDCCIPEAPLRDLQSRAITGYQYACLTNNYINFYKNKSAYWSKLTKDKII